MEAFSLPKTGDDEKKVRNAAIRAATLNAMQVPLKVMRLACGSLEVIKVMAETGNPNSVSDAGVGALCARTAVMGAWLNVKINAPGLHNTEKATEIMTEAASIAEKAEALEKEIMQMVEKKMK